MDSDYLQERQVLRRRVIACYVHLGSSRLPLDGQPLDERLCRLVLTS